MPTGDLMRRVMNLLLLAVSLLVPLNAQTYEPTWDSFDKRPIPAWFSDAKFEISFTGDVFGAVLCSRNSHII
jgi:alpha-L-fucosidase